MSQSTLAFLARPSNGAGKSTTIRILMGLNRQDGGEARMLGYSMPREQAAAKRDIGFVFGT